LLIKGGKHTKKESAGRLVRQGEKQTTLTRDLGHQKDKIEKGIRSLQM
jgi:hypothetical protein